MSALRSAGLLALWKTRRPEMLAAVRAAARKHGAWSVERRELDETVKAAIKLARLVEECLSRVSR